MKVLIQNEDEFTSKRGMIAGWLDTPPVGETSNKQFGSAVSGEGVIRLTRLYISQKIQNLIILD